MIVCLINATDTDIQTLVVVNTVSSKAPFHYLSIFGGQIVPSADMEKTLILLFSKKPDIISLSHLGVKMSPNLIVTGKLATEL